MKYLIIFFFIITASGHAQFNFERGYVVMEGSLERQEGYIKKNGSWLNNPDFIVFKTSEDANRSTFGIRDIKEFGVDGKVKFIKATVMIDKSSLNTEKLSTKRELNYVEETLCLKVLVEGEKSLYKYKNNNIVKYFYQAGEDSIQQLAYKKYRQEKEEVGQDKEYTYENKSYIRQLKTYVACSLNSDIKIPDYKEKDLVEFFKANNNCDQEDTELVKSYDKKEVPNRFDLGLVGGVSLVEMQARIAGEGDARNELFYEESTQFIIGAIAELYSANGRLSYSFELTYNSKYESENIGNGPENTLKYAYLRPIVALQYHVLLGDKSSIFLSGGAYFDVNLDGNILPPPLNSFESLNTTTAGGIIGLGAKINKLGIMVRYTSNKPFRQIYTDDKFTTLSFVLSYAIL